MTPTTGSTAAELVAVAGTLRAVAAFGVCGECGGVATIIPAQGPAPAHDNPRQLRAQADRLAVLAPHLSEWQAAEAAFRALDAQDSPPQGAYNRAYERRRAAADALFGLLTQQPLTPEREPRVLPRSGANARAGTPPGP